MIRAVTVIQIIPKILQVGGWAPALVFLIHAVGSRVFHVYTLWPQTDIPMHFAGGIAMAFFLSRCFRALPREFVGRSRLAVLECLLVGSLTATAAVLWEFAEFSLDQLTGSNVQVSLANTMQDMALGIMGAGVVIVVRAIQLGAGPSDVRQIAGEWLAGRTG